MKNISTSLSVFLNLAKINAVLTRRFDGGLGGLGFSDFLILHNLSGAKDSKMRRVDLAEAMGLTASGITRLLSPMEKIGLIKREANALDARVSYVVLAPGGKRMLEEAMERAERIAEEALSSAKMKQVRDVADILEVLAQTVR